jgi:hypothetical protein
MNETFGDRKMVKKWSVEQIVATGEQGVGGGSELPDGTGLLAGKTRMHQCFTGTDQVVENNGCLTQNFADQEGAGERSLITVLFHQRSAHRASLLPLQGLTKLLGTLGATDVRGN